MKKIKKEINAISSLMKISKALRDSKKTIVGLYCEDLKDSQEKEKCKTKLNLGDEECSVEEEVRQLGSLLNANPLETLLFVSIYSIQVTNNCDVDGQDIIRFLDISTLEFIPLKSSIINLLKKGLICEVGHRHSTDYRVSNSAENSLLNDKPFKTKKKVEIDRYQFCQGISSIIEDRSHGNIDTDELFRIVKNEEDEHKKLVFIKNTKKLLPDLEDRTLFYEICDDFIQGRRRYNTSVELTLSDIYDSMRRKLTIAKRILAKDHPVIVSGLVELLPAQFLAGAELALTEKGKREFLVEDFDLFCINGKSDSRLITPDKIPARELFFNKQLTKDIDFVKQSLQEESFAALQKRLEENSLPKGVALLLHGLPGTGKTAVAEMLAKETGRSIYHVDIAASKTCWFGESEKLFKKIFTDYKCMCENEKLKPILLFNEADALFSKRRDIGSDNCAQTENALQNILLEEMEKLDGILIATTNLCDNFDAAFERRFLFKIKFGKPTSEAKQAIWKSKLSWLSEDECKQLAAKYDMSGGEIDNIVRKTMMEEVLSGNRPTMEELEAWCRGDKISKDQGNAIGFSH